MFKCICVKPETNTFYNRGACTKYFGKADSTNMNLTFGSVLKTRQPNN